MSVRLSPAQQRALLAIPVRRAFIPEHTGFQWETLAKLKQLRLINSVKDGFAGKGKGALHVITPSGLRLRADLASGTEAQRATTVEQGVVHEGAVGDSRDAQPKVASPLSGDGE